MVVVVVVVIAQSYVDIMQLKNSNPGCIPEVLQRQDLPISVRVHSLFDMLRYTAPLLEKEFKGKGKSQSVKTPEHFIAKAHLYPPSQGGVFRDMPLHACIIQV